MARRVPKGVAVLGFDHVDVRFDDIPKARHFFEVGLGLEVLSKSSEHTFLLLGNQVLGLRKTGRPGGPVGVDHLAIRVERPEGLAERLHAAGIEVERTKQRDDSFSWFLRGPEGLEVELVHRPAPDHHECDTRVRKRSK